MSNRNFISLDVRTNDLIELRSLHAKGVRYAVACYMYSNMECWRICALRKTQKSAQGIATRLSGGGWWFVVDIAYQIDRIERELERQRVIASNAIRKTYAINSSAPIVEDARNSLINAIRCIDAAKALAVGEDPHPFDLEALNRFMNKN